MSFGVALPPAVPNTTHLRPSSPPLGPAAVLLINKDNGRGLAPPSRSQSTPTPRSEQHDTDSFQVLPIRPAPSGRGGDQRTRGVAISARECAFWALRALLNTGGARGIELHSDSHCAESLRTQPGEHRPGWGRPSRVSCTRAPPGQLCWAIHGRRWQTVSGGSAPRGVSPAAAAAAAAEP